MKVRQTLPKRVRIKAKDRCVSFDGDADRIVYYYQDQSVKFRLLDGDRIASLGKLAFIGKSLFCSALLL